MANTNLEKARERAEKWKVELQDGADVSDDDLDEFEKLLETIDELRTLVGDQREGKISEFFEEVGQGIVSAQQQLDQQSVEYNNARSSVAPPTSFRIPKVDAEIRFAMSKSSSKGFNVLLFGSKSASSQSQQNSVKFEIAAVPPPPDHVQGVPLQAGFVTSFEARNYVRDVTLAIVEADEALLPTPIKDALRDEFDDVLVVVDDAGRWLLLFERPIAGSGDRTSVTGLIVDSAQGSITKASINDDGTVPPSPQGRFNLVGGFLGDILASQIELLKPDTDA